MTNDSLPEMAPGGIWLQHGDRPAVYVTHEAHIKRNLAEGARVIGDPREEKDWQIVPAVGSEDPEKAAMRVKMAEMEAKLNALMAQLSQDKPAQDAPSEDVRPRRARPV